MSESDLFDAAGGPAVFTSRDSAASLAASPLAGGGCQPTVGLKVLRYFAGVMPTKSLNSRVKWL